MPVRATTSVDAGATTQGGFYLEDPIRRRHADALVELGVGQRLERGLPRIGVEAGPPLFERTQCLLERLAEGPPDRHHLAHRLHAGAEATICAREASRRPSVAPW